MPSVRFPSAAATEHIHRSVRLLPRYPANGRGPALGRSLAHPAHCSQSGSTALPQRSEGCDLPPADRASHSRASPWLKVLPAACPPTTLAYSPATLPCWAYL